MNRLELSTSKHLLISMICFLCSLLFVGSATAQTHQILLEKGRNQLLQQTTNGVVDAKASLLAADAACPNDVQEKKDIKFYLALAKLGCRFVEDNGGTVDTLAEALKAYGFVLQGDYFKDLTVVDSGLPTSEAPASNLLRQVLRNHVMPEIEATLDALHVLIEDDFLTVIPLGNQTFASKIEIDKGDLLLLKSGTHALLAVANFLSATDVDITRDDLRNMALSGNKLSVLDTLLANSSKFLTFDRITDNIEASKATIRAIESYVAGSGYIRNEDSLQTAGAEELFSISLDMALDEEEFRRNLEEVKNSMAEARVGTFSGGTKLNVNKVLVQNTADIPTDPRKMLPEIREGYFVLDTVGAGLGQDSTLDGIIPDATNQNWREWFASSLDGVFGFSSLGCAYKNNIDSCWQSFLANGDISVGIIESYSAETSNCQLVTFTEIKDELTPSYSQGIPGWWSPIGIDNNKFYTVNDANQLDEYNISQDGHLSESRTVLLSSSPYSPATIKNGLYFEVQDDSIPDSDGNWLPYKKLVGYDLRSSDQDKPLIDINLPSLNDFFTFTICITPKVVYVVGTTWNEWGATSKVVAVSLVKGETGNILSSYDFAGSTQVAVANKNVMYCAGDGEVITLSISNPQQIGTINRIKTYGSSYPHFNSIKKFGNTILLAGDPMLTAVDVTNATAPAFVSAVHTYNYSSAQGHVMIKDGKAMVSTYDGLHQLDIRLVDSDSDGLDDSWEQAHFETLSFRGDQDSDQDGLLNKDEMSLGTDPKQADSDGDGMSDGWEHKFNLFATFNDAALDMDGDGFSNVDEFYGGANPSDSKAVPSKKKGLQPGVLMLLLN